MTVCNTVGAGLTEGGLEGSKVMVGNEEGRKLMEGNEEGAGLEVGCRDGGSVKGVEVGNLVKSAPQLASLSFPGVTPTMFLTL